VRAVIAPPDPQVPQVRSDEPDPVPDPARPERVSEPVPESDDPLQAAREGSQLFHAALAFGLIPGVSLLLAGIGWMRLERTDRRWARRLLALGALDVGVFVALSVAMVMTAAQLGSGALLGGPIGPTGEAAPAVGPRPRIGVVVDEDDAGGVRILTVAPGSPAADVDLRADDRITALDGAAVATREALTEGIATGPIAPRRLTIARVTETRGAETLDVTVTPVAGPFRPVPLDAQRCADAVPDLEATRSFLTSPGALVGLTVVLAVVAALFAWGRQRGLAWRESAKVVLPLVGVLFVGPTLGGLLATLACPLLVSWNVRFETIEIFVSEIVLTAMALALLAYHRGLGASLTDREPVLGYARTVLQSCLYVAAWMPRALLLTTPVAVFFFAEGAFDEAPVAELVSGAGRTPLDATLTYVAAAVLAPIAEESLFRGVLAPHLGRLTDGFVAVLVTAAIFGVLHVGGHGPLFVGPMFLGAILGWARLRSGGLAAPITLHMMLNGTAMALALTLGLE
jgi:membrane protease YdiL (CAAX protease family)